MNVAMLILNVVFAMMFINNLAADQKENRGTNGFFLCLSLHNIATYVGRLS